MPTLFSHLGATSAVYNCTYGTEIIINNDPSDTAVEIPAPVMKQILLQFPDLMNSATPGRERSPRKRWCDGGTAPEEEEGAASSSSSSSMSRAAEGNREREEEQCRGVE